jgi:hypothetical protein
MQGPHASTTGRGLTKRIMDMVLAIVNTKINLDRVYRLKGGWEGWLQVEFALAAQDYQIDREQAQYPDSGERVDVYRFGKNMDVAIEFKCESFGQNRRFYDSLMDDVLKLKKLPLGHYGVLVGVVTDKNAGAFQAYLKDVYPDISGNLVVRDTNDHEFCVVVLDGIAST